MKKSDLKVGYSEGAEENKDFGDSQTTFSMETAVTNMQVQKN